MVGRPALALTLLLGCPPAGALAGDCGPPPDGVAKELESCGDHSNDGCNYLSHPTEPIEPGVPVVGTYWADDTRRDTDFYRFAVTVPTAVRVHAWGQENLQLAIVDACTIAGSASGTCCYADACLAPGIYEAFVAPLDSFPACGSAAGSYVLLVELLPTDPCAPLVGDIDHDGAVNGADVTQVLIAWGDANPGSRDLNADGHVDGRDLGLLLAAWTG